MRSDNDWGSSPTVREGSITDTGALLDSRATAPTSDAFHNLWPNPVGTTPVARHYVFFSFYIDSLPKN